MFAVNIVLAVVTLGVDTGWHPVGDGEMEYIIQIEPQLLDALRRGEELTSEIPLEVQAVRRYRIVVGSAQLPRIGLPPGEPPLDRYESPTIMSPIAKSPDEPFDVDPSPEEEATEPGPDVTNPLRRGPNRYSDIGGDEPAKVQVDPESKSLVTHLAGGVAERTASHTTVQEDATIDRRRDTGNMSPTTAADVAKPWKPFLLSLAGLFFSVGGNIYLGWITWDTRSRYRALAGRDSSR